ncbi:MAG: hypothetical protein U9Q70_11460 [Chloroflexota bacterium]|nr:hypothetical protein [Chloroflexota bacterium]
MSWILTIPDGFSLTSIIKYSAGLLLPPFTGNPSMAVIERVEELASNRVLLLTISQVPAGLQIQTSQHLDSAESEEISHKVWRMLRLGENLAPFFQLRANQKYPQHPAVLAGRLLRGTTLFEDVLKAFLLTYQREPLARDQQPSAQLITHLVDQLGGSLPSNPTRHAFPTCAKLQHPSVPLTELLGPALGQTTRELVGFCDTELAKIEELQAAHCSLETLTGELNRLPGMRPAMLALLMLSLGRYDYLPSGDYARHYVYSEPEFAVSTNSSKDFSVWHPWEGLAYWLGTQPSSVLSGSKES